MKKIVLVIIALLTFQANLVQSQSQYLFTDKWPVPIIDWYYNSTYQPESISTNTMLAIFNNNHKKWEAICNVKFNYKGQTSATMINSMNTNGVNSTNPDWLTIYEWSPFLPSSFNAAVTMAGIAATDLPAFANMQINFNRYATTTTQGQSEGLEGIINHEIGHVIGLNHLSQTESIMNPYHSPAYDLILRSDDIAACQSLYGPPALSTVPTEPISTSVFSPLPNRLTSLSLRCPSTVISGSTFTCAASASYIVPTTEDAIATEHKTVIPTYRVISDAIDEISISNGNISMLSTKRQWFYITASYTENGVTVSNSSGRTYVNPRDYDRVFNWAERFYPTLFAGTPTITTESNYTIRQYANGFNLAGKDGAEIWYKGGANANYINVGLISDFLPMAISAGY